jgi:hypothetical protein
MNTKIMVWIGTLCFVMVLLFVDKIYDAFKDISNALRAKLARRRYPYWYEENEDGKKES